MAPDPGERPETLRPSGESSGPDPVFGVEGWPAIARTSLDSPALLDVMAAEAGVQGAYDRAVDEFRGILFSLPDPPTGTPEGSNASVSVTGLVTYARCPKQYYWSEVDRLPRRPSRAARRGVEVHRLIELHNSGIVPIEEFHEVEYDDPGIHAGGPGPFEAFLASPYAERRPLLVEEPFEMRLTGGSVRGRIDAVYEDGGWEVVDFKSGRPSDDPATETQLQAYALAAASGVLSITRPERLVVSFVFLGDGYERRSQEVDDSWLERARDSIEGLLAGISAGSFDPRPSDRCNTCDFLRFCPEGAAGSE